MKRSPELSFVKFVSSIITQRRYTDFHTELINYIFGDNPRNFSYMIGFGDNYPQQPHHRGSSGSSPYGQPNEHVLYGALVRGPEAPDDQTYFDDRNNWISNEVGTGIMLL